MKKIALYLFLLLLVSACCSRVGTNGKPREIEIGEFVFQFPEGFKLIPEKGIDSYVGKITDGHILFRFDYGYYADELDQPVSEYLAQDTWKWIMLSKHNLLPIGDATGMTNEVKLINSETKDSIHYLNRYTFRGDTLDYTLTVSNEIAQTEIEMDTIGAIAYKFVRRSNYVGLSIKNLSRFNQSMNAYPALSITADQLSKQEVKMAYKILRSCKPRK